MVVDTSVFFEILSKGPLASKCEKQIAGEEILVPSLVLFEIYKKIKLKASEEDALSAIAALRAYPILDLTSEVALLAADLSIEFEIAMADAFMIAHARHQQVPLITLDNDFAHIPGSIVLRK